MPDRPTDRLGRPLHDLRISLIDRCNLRCTYCMPAEVFGKDYAFLKGEALLRFDEIESLVRAFSRLGVSKIRLTGGEPLLRKDVDQLIRKLSRVEGVEDIALTTNAILLPRYAEKLARAGLHRVNVSLDALDPKIFRSMNGQRGAVQQVLRGIDAATRANLRIKVNMVVEYGVNHTEVVPMARAFKERGITLRFIEFMDVGNVNGWEMKKVYPAKSILADLREVAPFEPVNPAYRGEVANRYRYRDGSAEFGIISSVTQPFCRDCSRARLSADGKLYTCLFAASGYDLRSALRGDPPEEAPLDNDALFELLHGLWADREDRYSEIRSELLKKHRHPEKVEMSYIGG